MGRKISNVEHFDEGVQMRVLPGDHGIPDFHFEVYVSLWAWDEDGQPRGALVETDVSLARLSGDVAIARYKDAVRVCGPEVVESFLRS